jgi:transcriptional regulator of nitric oxide reductase
MLIFLISTTAEAQSKKRSSVPVQGRSAVDRAPKKSKKVKVNGPVSAKKAKKKQKANDKKLRNDYGKFVKENQKRSIQIQTPEVQNRMKQNIKNADSNYKAKKKNSAARTKKARRKYK